MNLPVKQVVVETEYEVKLGVFEGPLDLLLYLVQKNELNPREIAISTITDQYLKYIDGIEKMNLSNAGEFLVMAARLMRLKARELLPADQKDELEEMEYELDRQALIQQMLEYQKFKEAARVLRNFEGKNFGAFARGREESDEDRKEEELEEEAGVFDLLAAFRSVVLQKPRPPVHEVEIDDVTIEDRMQEVEIALQERGRSLFEDLFPHDHRTIVKVVTLMAMLELCKLDRVVFRQSHALGPIWIYRKAKSADFEMELKVDEGHQDPLPEFKAGLPELIREQAKQRTAQTALEAALRELENELMNPGQAEAAKAAAEAAAAAQAATEAGSTEAGSTEAGSTEAGSTEAGSTEAGSTEAGSTEAGTTEGEASAEGTGSTGMSDSSGVDGSTGVVEPAVATEAGEAKESTDSAESDESHPSTETAPPGSAEGAGVPEGSATEAREEASEEPPSEAETAALRDILRRVQEAPEPDKSVPDPDDPDL